jgi:hypothetical protein
MEEIIMKKSLSLLCAAGLLLTLAACAESDTTLDPAAENRTAPPATESTVAPTEPTESTVAPTEPNEEPQFCRTIGPIAIQLGDLRGATSIRSALTEHIDTSRAIADGRMSADTVDADDSYSYSHHRIAEITEFYFPTIEIDGFELSSVTIFGSGFSFGYTPIGNREFNINTGVALNVTRTDEGLDDLPSSPTLEDLQKVFEGSRIADGLLFRPTGGIVGLVGETWFTLTAHPLDDDAAIDIATRFARTAERVTVSDGGSPPLATS